MSQNRIWAVSVCRRPKELETYDVILSRRIGLGVESVVFCGHVPDSIEVVPGDSQVDSGGIIVGPAEQELDQAIGVGVSLSSRSIEHLHGSRGHVEAIGKDWFDPRRIFAASRTIDFVGLGVEGNKEGKQVGGEHVAG